MPVEIVIEDVPEDVRDELEARAARRGQSIQEFLLDELGRLTAGSPIESRPTNAELFKKSRERLKDSGVRVPASVILEARDADRK